MSSQVSENERQAPKRVTQKPIDKQVDINTLRVMISTDNHLGYAEKDPIRSDDSFAAFEEVLYLAKEYNCDMVLLAGDLFHENKPSRSTYHRTMDILRRYCFGGNPVSFQILSDQKDSFQSSVYGTVNYEDPFSSVDLPVFSIHGNHDDPTRDGGAQMLAPLDLLAVNSLVNYFGRQDEISQIQISPILLRKGTTNVALYGMGSMRDERLNRMWASQKVRFLRPDPLSRDYDDEENDHNDDEGDQEQASWFNIFALHQNRDYGRGSKNCVRENMIPEWMDLVVWGHEHECIIHPAESAVGTFRITQPGSSVATSLSEGESMRKHVGILDIRGDRFRLEPVPLTQVRSFAMGYISLRDCKLDANSSRIDDLITQVLSKEVERLIESARSETKEIARDARAAAGNEDEDFQNASIEDDSLMSIDRSNRDVSFYYNHNFKYRVKKPDQVLVRLKVEHSGFSTIHNQRFGSQFVNEVANVADLLLFHRKSDKMKSNTTSKSSSNNNNSISNQLPIYPQDIADDVNVEDIVKGTLESMDKKLGILDEHKFGIAVEDYVTKEQRQLILETVDKLVHNQQNVLVRKGFSNDFDDENQNENERENGSDHGSRKIEKENKITTSLAVREVIMDKSKKSSHSQGNYNTISIECDDDDDDDADGNDSDYVRKSRNGKVGKSTSKKTARGEKTTKEEETKSTAPSRSRSTRKAAISSSAKNKRTLRDFDEDEDDEYFEEEEVEDADEDEYDDENEVKTQRKKSSRGNANLNSLTKRRKLYENNDDEDDSEIEMILDNKNTNSLGTGWGTAANTQKQTQRRRNGR